MRTWFLRIVGGVVLASMLMGATCSKPAPKPRKFDLRFSVGAALAGASVQVDIVGANPLSDLPRWETYSVSDYWKPGDPMRRDAPKAVVTFGPGKEPIQILKATDPVWNSWLRTGSSMLVILVDLPGAPVDRPGLADPRRLILSIDEHEWKSVKVLEFMIQESGIRLLTPKPGT